jgi:hypothetical protein
MGDLQLGHDPGTRGSEGPGALEERAASRAPALRRLEGTAGVQREPVGRGHDPIAAEPLMVAWLVGWLGVTLAPRSVPLPNGGRLDIDAASDDPPIVCAAWVHQGDPGSAGTGLITEAFKLVVAGRLLGDHYRLILLVCCKDAARHIWAGHSWQTPAIAAAGIELTVAELDPPRTARH